MQTDFVAKYTLASLNMPSSTLYNDSEDFNFEDDEDEQLEEGSDGRPTMSSLRGESHEKGQFIHVNGFYRSVDLNASTAPAFLHGDQRKSSAITSSATTGFHSSQQHSFHNTYQSGNTSHQVVKSTSHMNTTSTTTTSLVHAIGKCLVS